MEYASYDHLTGHKSRGKLTAEHIRFSACSSLSLINRETPAGCLYKNVKCLQR
jgi:hypothetical protein